MAVNLRPEHLRRYRDIAWLLWKHGRADWVTTTGLDNQLRDDPRRANGEAIQTTDPGPEQLAKDLESLGPTFIKIGQMLASRSDLLPAPYLVALSRLQDNVEPIRYEEIEQVIEAELPARPSRVFASIDPLPIATASLAQVHAAKLRDGRDVVIKVQRPGIQEEIKHDFEAFASLASLGQFTAYGRNYHLDELVEEFRRAIEEELDYRLEVDNLIAMRRNMEKYPQIQVPAPITDFCTPRVLTMERVTGTSIAKVSPVVFTEVKGADLAEAMFAAYLKQILIDGFFHADPHPGNVFLTQENRLALIDLGMVGRVDSMLRQHLLQLLIAVSEGRGREAGEVAMRIGTPTERFDRESFLERVSQMVMRIENASVRDIEAGRLVMQIQQAAGDNGLRLPRALALVGKTLLNLDTIGRIVAPDFNPNESIRRHSLELVQRRLRERFSPGNLFQTVLEMTDLAAQLPRRANELLTQVGKSGIRLDVDAFDEQTFVDGFQKVANRITTGLILAALIIGAALIMRIETSFHLLGYPGFAMLLFTAAAVGGIILLVQIMLHDRKQR